MIKAELPTVKPRQTEMPRRIPSDVFIPWPLKENQLSSEPPKKSKDQKCHQDNLAEILGTSLNLVLLQKIS